MALDPWRRAVAGFFPGGLIHEVQGNLLMVHNHKPSQIMLWFSLALTLAIAALVSAKQTRLQFSQSEALLASSPDVPP